MSGFKSRVYKRINHSLGQAIHDYGMISNNDRILVGVSGGLDSLTLLTCLTQLRKRAPVSFEILPAYIDPGFDLEFAERVASYFHETFGRLIIDYTDHGILSHSGNNRENPCFLCSRLRRKRLFEIAGDNGCTKIALGHNKDDLIETLFINMFYSGRIGTMKPLQSFFNGKTMVIRPLAYVEKKDIIAVARQFGFPEFVNPCPSSGSTKRDTVRGFLESLYRDNPNIKGNLFRSMGRVETDYLLKKR